MKSSQPGMCKLDGPMSIYHNQTSNIKEEQAFCSEYKTGKNGFCTYYRPLLGACSNFDGYFSTKENK